MTKTETKSRNIFTSVLMTLMVLCLVMVGMFFIAPIEAEAATGDTFTVDNLTYKVLTEEEGNYTVEVSGHTLTTETELVIPSTVSNGTNTYTVTKIASASSSSSGVFYNCTSLTSVTIPNNVTSIGWYAFYKCTGLTSVTIPSSVTSIGKSAFYWCSALTSVTIPDSVTSIGNFAFSDCNSLTSVTIPENVKELGAGSFSCCSSLTEFLVSSENTEFVSINGILYNRVKTELIQYPAGITATSFIVPETVTSIRASAFAGCNSLTSVTIPDGVTSIDESTFFQCSALTSVTIPEGVTSIGSGAFEDCTSFTSVTIPEKVTSIGSWAFSGCTGLTSVTIPDGVTSIGYRAFRGCTGLTSVTIPNSVTSIDSGAFKGCTGLTSVTIPEKVTEIKGEIFYGCTGLTSVTIPDSVTSIGYSAFEGCTSLTSVTIPNSVTSIGRSAFEGCTSLTSVTIPNSVTSIGRSAFEGCTSLTSVTIFSNNTHFTIEWLTNTVTTVYGYANSTTQTYCTTYHLTFEEIAVSKICIPEASLTQSYVVGDEFVPFDIEVVWNSGAITTVRAESKMLSDFDTQTMVDNATATVTYEGATASFTYTVLGREYTVEHYQRNVDGSYTIVSSDTETLRGVGTTEAVAKTYEGYTAQTFEQLEIAADGTTVVKIYYDLNPLAVGDTFTIDNLQYKVLTSAEGSYTVEVSGHTLTKSTDLVIPATVRRVDVTYSVVAVGKHAFEQCAKLTSVSLPSGMTSIGGWAFKQCTNLTTVNLPEGLTSIEASAFSYNRNIVSITLPSTLTTLGASVFYQCSGLKSVNIPNTITSISGSLFGYCTSLESITLHKGVTIIYNYAFKGCTALTNIVIPKNVEEIYSEVFNGCSALETITILSENVTFIAEADVIPSTITMVYGYANSTAQTYCTANNLPFTALTNAWTTAPTINGWAYGQSANAPTYEAEYGNSTVLVEYRLASGTDADYTTTVPTNAGAYKVRFTVEATEDYGELSHVLDLTIAKANPTITSPTVKTGLTYTSEAQTLITAGSTTGGTMQYKLGDDGTWSATLPTAINAGTYKIYYKVVGDGNYNDADGDYVNVTIAKKNVTVTAENKTVAQFGTMPEFTYTTEGVIETNYTFDTAPVAGVVIEDTNTYGTYTISVSGGEDTNYNFVYYPGTLTVTEHTNCVYDNDCDTICNLCSGTRTVTHNFTGEWQKDADGHWHVCTKNGCTVTDTKQSHVSAGAATETDPEACSVCGWVINSALGHTTHTAETEWQKNDTHHWHECTGCSGQELNKASHVDGNGDGKCDTCDYEMSNSGNGGSTAEPPVDTDPPVEDPDNSEKDEEGLGTGAIVAIVICSVAGVGGGGFALYWFVIRKKKVF